VRARALNPYALLMAELIGPDLALSRLPADARLPLVTGSVTAAALGITWLVMVALGHPPTLEAARLWNPERWHLGLAKTDQGRSIVSGPVITGGAFRSFAAARSSRS
jgi:hypothetical protein